MYVIEYHPTKEWALLNGQMTKFSGEARFVSLDGIVMATTKFNNGVVIKDEITKGRMEECETYYKVSYTYTCVGDDCITDIEVYSICDDVGGGTDSSITGGDDSTGEDSGGNNGGGTPIGVLDSESVIPSNTVLFQETGPSIKDIETYLECFNTNANATLTIYVDQPKAGSRETWIDRDPGFGADIDVGHTFIGVSQQGVTRYIGFYPRDPVTPGFDNTAPSVLINDNGHAYDVSISVQVNAVQLSNILNLAKKPNSVYNLNTYNCTDFALDAAQKGGLNLKDTYGTWGLGGGSNPGDLGEDIRQMKSSNVNKTGGSTNLNSGSCE